MMSVELFIIWNGVAWGLCWLVLGVSDRLHARGPLPPITQPSHQMPPMPSTARADPYRAPMTPCCSAGPKETSALRTRSAPSQPPMPSLAATAFIAARSVE